MKYKELERRALRSLYTIKRIGVNTVIERERIIYNRTDRIIIDETQEKKITISMLTSSPDDFEFLTSALAYAETPLEERQEENKYYLKHRFLSDGCGECFLNYDLVSDDWRLNNKTPSIGYKTQFTQEEIDEIKGKYKTTLDDFEQIEVEE
ncbi:hypothetical protein [Peptoniphilus vaginalis]|uniref:hypothetical protein n=1 Tax=Peptoniphilus vaginalis TaxID=1756987 RepID=UPI0023F68932|nr:hypothetical protein [Peptoniphilus vaginalis]